MSEIWRGADDLGTESKILIVRTETSHVNRVQGSRAFAQGDVGGSIVMFQSIMRSKYVRPEERSILVIWGIAVSSNPRPVLPEASIRLLITEKIMVVGVRFRTMHGELIW